MCKIHLSLPALEEKIKLPTQANSTVDNQAYIVSDFSSILHHCLDLSGLKDCRGYLNKTIIFLKKKVLIFWKFHIWLLYL